MASAFYNNYHEELGKGNINYSTATLKLMLVTTAYTLDVDTQAFRADITGEASGAGYTAGGQAVGTVTWTQDNTNNRAVLDFADETFTAVTVTNVKGAILYKDTGNAATDILIAYIEFAEGAQSTVANDFIVQPNASGVLTNG